MMSNPLNEQIVDRAVELWIRMLRDPKYDNIGYTGTQEERMHSAVASNMAKAIPNNATEERLAKFGEELKSRLMSEENEYYRSRLSVDYGPDLILAEAAEVSGLKIEFPWKTNMMINSEFVGLSYGYGADYVYHYPLSEGKWLVTRLQGEDIDKVKALAEQGLGGFEVEGETTDDA